MEDRFAERYSRQIMLPEIGEEGQQRLAAASVLIVGLGGLGSPAALYLAGAGVGRIGLADPDTVSLSNLQRQILYTEAQAMASGYRKVDAAESRLKSLSKHTEYDKYPEGLTPENALEIVSDYDLILDCCDNFATRYLLDDVCAKAGKPWVHASIGDFIGQITVLNHRAGKKYTDLYPDQVSLSSRPKSTAGVIGPTAGILGTMQALEAMKILAGFGQPLDGRLLYMDLLTLDIQVLTF